MKAQYRLIFARKGVNAKGLGLVQIQVFFDRKHRKLISTGEKVLQDHWDPVKERIKPLSRDLIKQQERIDAQVREIEDFELELIHRKEYLTLEKLNEFLAREGDSSFNAFIEAELKADKTLKYGTTKGHWKMLRKLNAFQPGISFDQVNYDLVHRFNNHLHTLGLSTNSIADQHKCVRRFIKLAIKKGLMDPKQDPYAGKFKPKREATTRAFLSDEEVAAIEKIDYSGSDKLARIQDMFLFCCYTGLRFSDMQNLQVKHLQRSREGWEIMLHKMIKVPQPVFLPIHMLFDGKGERILVKYLPEDGKIFPEITSQKANEYLKTVVSSAEISKRITWHSSRHYFGSALAWRLKNPLTIMKLMGHGEIKTTMIYIHHSHEMMKQELSKVEWARQSLENSSGNP